MKRLMLTTFALSVPFLSQAHEGHGVLHNTIWHYVFSFWHLLPVILMILLIIYAVRRHALPKKTSIK